MQSAIWLQADYLSHHNAKIGTIVSFEITSLIIYKGNNHQIVCRFFSGFMIVGVANKSAFVKILDKEVSVSKIWIANQVNFAF